MSLSRFRLRAYHPVIALIAILMLVILACGDDDATSPADQPTAEPTSVTQVQETIKEVFGEEPESLGV